MVRFIRPWSLYSENSLFNKRSTPPQKEKKKKPEPCCTVPRKRHVHLPRFYCHQLAVKNSVTLISKGCQQGLVYTQSAK